MPERKEDEPEAPESAGQGEEEKPPEVEAEVVDAEFEDSAGEASDGSEPSSAADSVAPSHGIMQKLRKLSPGIILFFAFIVVALAAFGIWRLQTGPSDNAEEMASPLSEEPAGIEEEAAAQPDERTEAQEDVPEISTPQDKIINTIEPDAKQGAQEIEPGESDETGRGLPPAPPSGSSNDALQNAAKDAARTFRRDEDAATSNDDEGVSFEIEENSDPEAADDASSNDDDLSERPNDSADSGQFSAATAPQIDRQEFDRLVIALEEERARSQEQAQEIAALRQDLRRVTQQRNAQAEAAIADLSARIDEMESDAGSVPDERRAAASLALISLSRAIDGGGTYEQELDSMERVAPDLSALEQLRPAAEDGLPTLAELKTAFPEAARAALTAAARERATGPASKMLAKFQTLVAVRPAHPGEDSTPAAIISRAENHLLHERLSGAVAELDKLEGGAKAAFEDWLNRAQARVEANKALSGMAAALLDEYAN